MAKTYNTIPSVATGDVYTATAHNNIVTNVNNYRVPPMCALYRSTAQSLANTTSTVITFPSGTEQIDTDAMHDDSVNNSRITINTAGIYLVGFQFEFALSGGGGRRTLQLRKNGSPTGLDIELPSGSGYYPRAGGSQLYSLAVNDYVDLSGYQDSGGALNLDKVNFFATWQGQVS